MKKIVMMMFAALFAMNVLADNVKFQIKNLNCENCAKRAEKALTADKGVKEVAVNLEEQTVTVKYDDAETNEAKLIEDLKAGRFEASVAGKKCENCQKHAKEGAAAGEHKHGEHQHGGDCCEGEKK
jgi:copper chaperone CopZ